MVSLLLRDVRLNIKIDTAADAVRGGTTRGMPIDRSLGLFPHAARNRQCVPHANAGNPQDFVDGLDVALDRGADLVGWSRNVAHLQCACQGAEQSSPDCGDHMVERGWHLLLRLNPVERFDAAMHAESDRGVEALQECLANRSLYAFDS